MNMKKSEDYFLQIANNYYYSAYFDLISNFINQLEILQKENELLKSQYEFISTISHQFRTPLSGIKMSLEILKGGNKEIQEGINNKVENLVSITNNLLFFLEVIKMDSDPDMGYFNIYKMINGNIKALKEKIKKKKIRLDFQINKKNLKIFGNEKMLNKAIGFILDNAVIYNKEKGTVSIKVDNIKSGDFVKIRVKDTGIGIPLDEQDKVFSKFFRSSNASLGKNEGSGISLYLVKDIISKHKGEIGFKSKENIGTEFYFILPTNDKNFSFDINIL